MRALLLTLLGVLLVTVIQRAREAAQRQAAARRLEQLLGSGVAAPDEPTGLERALADWLAQGGYRDPRAPQLFLMATVGSTVLGLLVGQLYGLTVRAALVNGIAAFPGSAGDVLAELLASGAGILLVVGAVLPFTLVRTARRLRVRAIERDLPLALEMLAMMAEAGLSFDAAVAQLVKARGSERPLSTELLKFQRDMLAGMPRAQALRQLSRRIKLPAMTSFTSALIQAEALGASVAETLQLQALDMRQRRKEDALLRAQALPVKLVFPLVICFLPGIFLSTLAPVMLQMVQVAGGVLRSGQ